MTRNQEDETTMFLMKLGRKYGIYCLDEGDLWENGRWCAPLVLHRKRSGEPIMVHDRLWRHCR